MFVATPKVNTMRNKPVWYTHIYWETQVFSLLNLQYDSVSPQSLDWSAINNLLHPVLWYTTLPVKNVS